MTTESVWVKAFVVMIDGTQIEVKSEIVEAEVGQAPDSFAQSIQALMEAHKTIWFEDAKGLQRIINVNSIVEIVVRRA